MSSFTQATGIKPSKDKDKWIVTEQFSWYFNEPYFLPTSSASNEQKGIELKDIIIPSGFAFNGADIPFPITAFWPRIHVHYVQAACLHDYMLQHERHTFTRDFIDIQFHDALLALGNNKVKSWCMYQAVRVFGILTEREFYWMTL